MGFYTLLFQLLSLIIALTVSGLPFDEFLYEVFKGTIESDESRFPTPHLKVNLSTLLKLILHLLENRVSAPTRLIGFYTKHEILVPVYLTWFQFLSNYLSLYLPQF